jgi:hypothetical protein
MRLSSVALNNLCGFSISLPDRLVCGSLLPFDDDPSQPVIALEAVPVYSSYWDVPARLTQDNAEVPVTLRTRAS